jgi:hypothetical protein
MTSTPNSSFDTMENRIGGNGKTAHNTIGRRKSKRLSKRTPVPLIVSLFLIFFISIIMNMILDD